MKNSWGIFLITISALAVQMLIVGSNIWALNERQIIMPNAQIQRQISRIAAVKEENEILPEILKLKKMESGNRKYLLQQLIYFRVDAMKRYNSGVIDSKNMERAMNNSLFTIGKILNVDRRKRMLDHNSAQDIINAVIPYLGTTDRELKKQLYRMLKMIDYRGINKANYHEYKLFIEQNKADPPQKLVEYMYKKSPREALLTLLNIYEKEAEERKIITDLARIISADMEKQSFKVITVPCRADPEAKKALDKLSNYKQWWVKIYVDEVLRRKEESKKKEEKKKRKRGIKRDGSILLTR